MVVRDYPLCRYAFYETQPNNIVVLKCQKSNKICAYSRYCSMLLKVVHTEAYTNCAISKQ